MNNKNEIINKSELFSILTEGAVAVLNAPAPNDKVRLTFELAAQWRREALEVGSARPPQRPARPAKPELKRAGEMPKRSTGPKGRMALVHALAHIELNAIDLAWDIIARFAGHDLPRAFFDDWVDVAAEEAEHYRDLAQRLTELGLSYGDLPAHDGLWEAADITADDLLARLALIPMTLEARGLDTTPQTCVKLRGNGDEETARILDVIFTDEIKHLKIGVRWFEFECARRKLSPHAHYKTLLEARFTGTLKPPFNMPARLQADMTEAYLQPWLASAA
ncbi:MAG: ferritin-like domain-containing protein [Rhodospirillaceae bacterium]|nr:ferritin-like domain-containing protein [Rhodospirillaceae bacterium]